MIGLVVQAANSSRMRELPLSSIIVYVLSPSEASDLTTEIVFIIY